MKKSVKLLLASFFFLTACNLGYFQDAEFGELIWDPTIAMPLGELNYTVTELFSELDNGSAEIGPGEDNVVTIVYEENINAQDARDFLEVLDQQFQGIARAGVDINNSPVEQVVRVEQLFEFDLSTQESEEYDSIYFNSGLLELEFNSSIENPVAYEAQLISLNRDNQVLAYAGDLNLGDTEDQDDVLDESNGYFYLDAQDNISNNKFLINLVYEVTVPVGGSLRSTNGVSFDIGFRDAEFKGVFGDFGKKQINIGSSSVPISFFDIFSSGQVRFGNPTVDFFYENSFGFPIGMDYTNISVEDQDGAVIQLTGPITEQRSIVDAPLIEQAGTIVNTQHQVNSGNSNIVDLFSSQPSEFVVQINALSNPDNGPLQYNFLNEDHELEATARIEIPLDMAIRELVANQNLDFKNASSLEQATRALMRIEATNDMPMGGNLEIEFLNTSGEVFYTLDERAVFDAAPVGPNGRTTGKVKKITEVLLENEDLRQMEQAARINVKSRLNTTDIEQNRDVKFFDDYVLNLQIGLLVDLSIKSQGQ